MLLVDQMIAKIFTAPVLEDAGFAVHTRAGYTFQRELHSSGNFLRRERLRLAMRLAYQIFAVIFCVSDASLGGARPFVAKAPMAHLRNSFPQLPAEIKPLSLVILSPSTEHSSDWLRDTNATIAWMVVGGAPNDGPRSPIRLNVRRDTVHIGPYCRL